MKGFFVSGIGTGVGKSVVAAALVEAFAADYWKPVQSGIDEGTDTELVTSLVTHHGTIHPERFVLKLPLSPHAAAAADGVSICLDDFVVPETDNTLVVEGAGGLLVPLNTQDLVIDLIAQLGLPLVLVSRNYLGSINHTLMSVEVLQARQIPVAGIVFVGESNRATEDIILSRTGLRCIARIPLYEVVDRQAIAQAALLLKGGLK